MYYIFGHVRYDIFVFKQNNLVIIKVSFSFAVEQAKIVL